MKNCGSPVHHGGKIGAYTKPQACEEPDQDDQPFSLFEWRKISVDGCKKFFDFHASIRLRLISNGAVDEQDKGQDRSRRSNDIIDVNSP